MSESRMEVKDEPNITCELCTIKLVQINDVVV